MLLVSDWRYWNIACRFQYDRYSIRKTGNHVEVVEKKQEENTGITTIMKMVDRGDSWLGIASTNYGLYMRDYRGLEQYNNKHRIERGKGLPPNTPDRIILDQLNQARTALAAIIWDIDNLVIASLSICPERATSIDSSRIHYLV